MNTWLLALVSAIYGVVSVRYAMSHNWGAAIMWGCYGLANIGAIMLSTK